MKSLSKIQIQTVKDSKCFKRPLSQPKDAPVAKKRGDILQSKQNQHIHTNVRIQQLYKKCTVAQTTMKPPRKTTPSKRGKGRVSVGRTPKAERKSKEKPQASAAHPTSAAVKSEKSAPVQPQLSGPSVIVQQTIPIPIQSPPPAVVQHHHHQQPHHHHHQQGQIGDDGGHSKIFVPQIATSKKDIASNLTKLISNTPQQPQPIVVAPYTTVGGSQPAVVDVVVTTMTTPTKSTINNLIQTTATGQKQQIIKMIPAQSIKISNNLLQKSLAGKLLGDSSSLPIGAKINFQLQPNVVSLPKTSTIHSASSIVAPPHTVSLTPSHAHHQLLADSSSSTSTTTTTTTYKVINAASSLVTAGQPSTHKIGTSRPQHHVNVKNNYKVQILSHQILQSPHNVQHKTITSPATTSPVKLTPNNVTTTLKSLQPKTQIKLIPSPAGIGKMLLKSTSGTVNKITGITQLKVPTSKVQLIGGTTTTQMIGDHQNHPLSSKPPPMIVMHKLNQMTGGNPLRGVKISKEMNKIIMNTKNVAPIKTNFVTTTAAASVTATSTGGRSGQPPQQNNVIVLGISEILPATMTNSNLSKSSVITEDTPVDIIQSLPSPSSSMAGDPEMIINGETTTMVDVVESSTQIMSSPIKTSSKTTTTKSEDVSMDGGVDGEKETPETTVETITDWEMELDQANQANISLRHGGERSSSSRGGGSGGKTESEGEINETTTTSDPNMDSAEEDLEDMLQDGLESTMSIEKEVHKHKVLQDSYESQPEDRLGEFFLN